MRYISLFLLLVVISSSSGATAEEVRRDGDTKVLDDSTCWDYGVVLRDEIITRVVEMIGDKNLLGVHPRIAVADVKGVVEKAWAEAEQQRVEGGEKWQELGCESEESCFELLDSYVHSGKAEELSPFDKYARTFCVNVLLTYNDHETVSALTADGKMLLSHVKEMCHQERRSGDEGLTPSTTTSAN